AAMRTAEMMRRAAAVHLDGATRPSDHRRMDATERRTLIDRYRLGINEVDDAVRGAPAEDLDRRPAPGEWSAREVAHHLADSETMSTIRLRRLIAEDEPIIQAYDEAEFARRLHYDRPIDASLTVFASVRSSNLELLDSL